MAKQPRGRLYPTVAVSDGFFAGCLFYAAQLVRAREPAAALGLQVVGAAAGFGVLRFGFLPRVFTKYNEAMARLAGSVGFPLLCLAFARRVAAAGGALAPFSDLDVAVGLAVAYVVVQQSSAGMVELYETIVNGAGMAAAFYFGFTNNSVEAMVGAVLFIVTGILIGSDREKCLAGVRCENWFHYLLGASVLLLAQPLR